MKCFGLAVCILFLLQDNPDPAADLSDDLEELKALTSDLIAQGRLVDDLKQVNIFYEA